MSKRWMIALTSAAVLVPVLAAAVRASDPQSGGTAPGNETHHTSEQHSGNHKNHLADGNAKDHHGLRSSSGVKHDCQHTDRSKSDESRT